MIIRLLVLLSLALLATVTYAQQFTPPDNISYGSKMYTLAFKNVQPNGRAIYEFTTDGEPIENWSTLITVNHAKSVVVASPFKWVEALKASLDRTSPKPHYSLYLKKDNGYAKIIYEPNAQHPVYESNVHKSFHVDACGGLVVFQFARKYSLGADQTAEGKLATLKQVAKENGQFADDIENHAWLPTCKAEN